MAEFLINDKELESINGKVVIVTGCSSGIGLAATNKLLSLGAIVIGCDVQTLKEQSLAGTFTYVPADVTAWADQVAVFKTALSNHGRIDAVFCNAGLGPRADYLSLAKDENGDPKEPNCDSLDVSLKGAMNTAILAIHYMRQQTDGGSIVINGSTTGLQRFRAVDYSTAKHGIIGFGRGIATLVKVANLPINVNTLVPTWTDSSILPGLKQLLDAINVEVQPAEAVAKAAIHLMVDKSRHGHMIHCERVIYKEIDEAILLPTYENRIKGPGYPIDDEVLARVEALGESSQ